MISQLGRRAFGAVVGLFALLGFFSVPLGERTGFQHLSAILKTEPSRHAAQGFLEATQRARQQLSDAITKPDETAPANLHLDGADAGSDASL